MGRPLNKKYFGNTNLGSPSTGTDDGIGGHSIASVRISVAGTYTTRPVITFASPQLAGGVLATATMTSEALTATIAGTQTKAYQVGQVLATTGDSTWTVATITGSTTIGTVAIAGIAGQFTCAAATLTVGQSVVISGTNVGTGSITGYTNPTTYYIGATNGTTTFTLVSTYAAAISGTGGAIVTTAGTPTGLTYTVNTIASRAVTVTVATKGSYTTLAAGAQATTSTAGGAGATLTITYGAKAVVLTEVGSGYTSVTPTSTQGVTLAVAALTSDVGGIVANAFIPAADGGTASAVGDIVKQSKSRSFKVKTTDGTGVCKLVAAAPTAGQMTIKATDSAGKTYYVTKLTSRRATLTPYGAAGHIYSTGESAQWTFASATGSVKFVDAIVQIENN